VDVLRLLSVVVVSQLRLTLTPCARVWAFIRNTSDVHTVSDMNVLMYADNTDLLVPDYSEFELAKEFDNIDYSATLLRLWR